MVPGDLVRIMHNGVVSSSEVASLWVVAERKTGAGDGCVCEEAGNQGQARVPGCFGALDTCCGCGWEIRCKAACSREIRLETGISSRLQPPEPGRLRRDIARLRRVKATPAARLREMLELEYRAVEGAAREHPVTRGLLRLAQDINPPAALILISARTHDGTALAVAADRLRHGGYDIISQSNRV